MSGIGGHERAHHGEKDEWLTPPEIVAALGPFDLDPCSPSPERRPWPTAALHYAEEDNGLAREWAGYVWCNPPYGPQTGVWLEKLAAHGNGMALIFARTETKMFFEHVWRKATALCFIEKRLRFYHASGVQGAGAGGPSVLLAYGDYAKAKLWASGIRGAYVDGWASS